MLKNKDFWVIILLLFSIIIFVSTFYFQNSLILEEKEFDALLLVGDRNAFSVNGSVLDFGMISRVSTAKRTILLENNFNSPIEIGVSVSGLIGDFLFYEKKIYLGVGEVNNLEFVAFSDENSIYGEYSGKVEIIIRKAK
jgi:hypothetical protein